MTLRGVVLFLRESSSEPLREGRRERVIEPAKSVWRKRRDDPFGEIPSQRGREPLGDRRAPVPTASVELLHVCEEPGGASRSVPDELGGDATHPWSCRPAAPVGASLGGGTLPIDRSL